VEQIEHLAQRAQFQETAASRRVLDDLALEANVRAALRQDARTNEISVVIQCADGMAKLLGMVSAPEAAAAAHEVAAKVMGVRSVQNELRAAGDARSRYLRDA
jgi:osmotically-inducible protein OsmY